VVLVVPSVALIPAVDQVGLLGITGIVPFFVLGLRALGVRGFR